MPDAYTDLDTLAANGDGLLWRRGMHWSYAIAPTNSPLISNIVVPSDRAPDARVQAAIADAAWVPAWGDHTKSPVQVLAVVKAPSNGSVVRAKRISEFGSVAP